jgi:phosphate acyltransferase
LARIALDAMGGDMAPVAPIEGALLALSELDTGHTVQLVGRESEIVPAMDELLRGRLSGLASLRARLELVDAADVVTMSDKPTAALRSKPDSSLVKGLRMHAAGDADAFVSAGNTGAQMAASVVLLKLHNGLTRPAIGTPFPTAREPVIVIDSGANVDCSPAELLQFARLGSVYAEDLLGRTNPTVGLLSIGEEPEKGNAAVKEAHKLLAASDINFHGNIEGRDVIAGATERGPFDVVVCDGFVGNVLLKFYESVAPQLSRILVEAGVSPDVLERVFRTLDYSEYGGAPLLGVRGVSIICHGSSSPRAIKNALRAALRAVDTRMNEHIGRRLARPALEEV